MRFFDKRILTLDTPDAERFITSEKKNLLVDSFVKWRINDARQYYISVGDEVQRADAACADHQCDAARGSSASARCTTWYRASAT